MGHSSKHLSDEYILLLLDRELPQAQAEIANRHLAQCPECRARFADKRHTLETLGDLFLVQGAAATPSASARVGIERQMNRHNKTSPWWSRPLPTAAIAASLLLVAGGLAFLGGFIQKSGTYVGDAGSVPNLNLTPGAIRTVTLNEICATTDDEDDLDPPLPPSIQNAVFQEYGIAPKGQQQNYQIDYLVNPQLGGTDDIRNLWPQSYRSGVWDARAKDQLEERLHQMVCNRTMDLATAQRAITTDWIAAYKKYVQQPRPRT
jgi:hypothetical protein